MMLRLLAILAGLFLYLVVGRYLFRVYLWLGCFADDVPYSARKHELAELSGWQVFTWPLLLLFLPFYAVWVLAKRLTNP
ncbi:MAG: hypothetical protein GF399_05815 [Candidatus Coatesbacteria bacterium]|nr:hypothetical protein [Candidatus Coatesbacteria bacterium]